ncbi:MAG: phytanoyl-CoA dioxygenase family protein [Lentisphaeria bacterium]|nr:phytanoyl-CoA dioxygenase family protein [Lentisphaeria bacterium]NQZ68317.1 phytanoyl-CoA dioxygenase family protein [Lentisphaeria bacterium]
MFADCPEFLSERDIALYWEHGYLAFENCLSIDEVEKAHAAITELVNEDDPDYIVQFEPNYIADSKNDPEKYLRKLMYFKDHHPFTKFLHDEHEKIRMIRENLLGSYPIAVQDTALVKAAKIGSEKPWHQDTAYFSVVPMDRVLGFWIALDDATIENGCMHVIDKGHKRGPIVHHHLPVIAPDSDGTLQQSDYLDCQIGKNKVGANEAKAIELKAGGVLIFNGLLPHQTPPNVSDERRRALQFHYRGKDTRQVNKEEYDDIFAESGEPASCSAAVDREK